MKSKLTFSSLSRPLTFSKFSVIGHNVGLKYLTTVATTGETETEFATANTSVWWDIENCEVPKGCDGRKIVQNIRSAMQEKNYRGSITIYAYGDTNRIPSNVQHALSSTGVSLNHVPPGVKDGSDKKILVDMLLWAMENRAPANIVLISGDGDFSYVLHQLGMKKYNVLLVRPESASFFLIAAAKTVWLWRIIVGAGSGYEVPKQAQPRKKTMSSDWVVKSTNSQRFCTICNITCSTLGDFNSHLSGKKHKNQAAIVAKQEAKFSFVITRPEEKPKPLWCCSLCQVRCESKVSYQDHIFGRGHKIKLEAIARNSR